MKMTDENRDPVTEDAGVGSDEARLFTPGNGGRPADPLMSRAPGSTNRSEETSDSAEETDEELDETADLDEEDLDDEDEDDEDEDDEDLLDEEEEEDEDDEATT
jgi:hypothetical protein